MQLFRHVLLSMTLLVAISVLYNTAHQGGDVFSVRRFPPAENQRKVRREELSGDSQVFEFEDHAANEGFEYPIADPGSCSSEADRGEAVLKWVASMGAEVNGDIAITQVARGGVCDSDAHPASIGTGVERQIQAKGTIGKGSALLVIPSALHMSVHALRGHQELADVYSSIPALHSSMFGLAFLLLHEAANTTSFWRRYLCSLPAHPPLPLLMDEAALKASRLRLPPQQWHIFDDLVSSHRARVEAFFEKVVKQLLEKFPRRFRAGDYSQARSKWAFAIIMSRAFPSNPAAPTDTNATTTTTTDSEATGDNVSGGELGEGDIYTLAPGADMPNHEPASLGHELTKDGAILLRESRRLRLGSPVTISYGNKCSAHMLAQYGFVADCDHQIECDVSTKRRSEIFLSLFSELGPVIQGKATSVEA